MKIIKPYAEILAPDINNPDSINAVYTAIEEAGRTSYLSEPTGTNSGRRFVEMLVKNQHESVLEHAYMRVRFVVDRGVSHEIVRHRLASFTQESQRYCAYDKDKFGGEVTFIEPIFFEPKTKAYQMWLDACLQAESTYLEYLKMKVPPEQARTVLPNSTKTTIAMTANMREWRHFFELRAEGSTGKPHPQMLQVAVPLLEKCATAMPELFGDIWERTKTK